MEGLQEGMFYESPILLLLLASALFPLSESSQKLGSFKVSLNLSLAFGMLKQHSQLLHLKIVRWGQFYNFC